MVEENENHSDYAILTWFRSSLKGERQIIVRFILNTAPEGCLGAH